jgi:hypothetical protein
MEDNGKAFEQVPRGRPSRGITTTAVLLRCPAALLQRIDAHKTSLEAQIGIPVARHDIILQLLTRALDALDRPAVLPAAPAGPVDAVKVGIPTLNQEVPVVQEPVHEPAPNALLQAIAEERTHCEGLSIKAFAERLYAKGIYRSKGASGVASVSLVHKWLHQAHDAGLLE